MSNAGTEALRAAHPHVRFIEIPFVAKAPWIDGDLDDPTWGEALALSAFLDLTAWIEHRAHCAFNDPRQFAPEPQPGPAEPATRVLCCHDGGRLYIGFVCEDRNRGETLRREHPFGYGVEQEDCVYVWLDPQFTHLAPHGCEYIVNAAGQKTERLRGRPSGDYTALMAWEGRVRLTPSGWTAAIMLPLERLGLAASDNGGFGLNFGRGFRGTWRTHAHLPFDGEVRAGRGVALLLGPDRRVVAPVATAVGAALERSKRVQSGRALPTEPAGLYKRSNSTQDENAMIGLSVWGPDQQPTLTVGRADSYDRRWYGDEYPVVTRREVIDAALSGDPQRLDALRQRTGGRQYNAYGHFPAPKPVGQAILSLPGGAAAGWVTDQVAAIDGARDLTCRCTRGEVRLHLYVHKRRNLVVVEGTQQGFDGEELILRLYRHHDSPRLRRLPGYNYDADLRAGRNVGTLTPPQVGIAGDLAWLRQDFIAEPTFPEGFAVLLAASVRGLTPTGTQEHTGETGLGTPAYSPYEGWTGPLGNETWAATEWERANALPGSAVTVRTRFAGPRFRVFLPAVSTNDGPDLVAAATALVTAAAGLTPTALEAESQAATVRERTGDYRYKQDLALGSIFSAKYCVSDGVAWHGDFHHNEWAGFLTFHDLFPLGRTADLESFFQMIETSLPAAQALARDAFGCRGAAWGVASFPIRLQRLPLTVLDWDYSLENTGFTLQPFWLTYQYTMDRDFLARAYAVLREGARFYTDYMTREADGLYHIWPCVSSEHVPLQPHLRYNRDATAALSMVRFTLAACCEAARTLGTDADLVQTWEDILAHLAPYPVEETPDGPRFVDVAGARLMTEYNIFAPLFPVFYGNDIGLASPPEEQAKAKRSLEGLVRISTGGGHYLHVYRAMVRLGLYPGGPVTCENLLQSHQGPAFLFPAVPERYTGGFTDYHARGGFVVSAAMREGEIGEVRVRSRIGGRVRVDLAPWRGRLPPVRGPHEPTPATTLDAGRYLAFDTEAGAEYVLAPYRETARQ